MSTDGHDWTLVPALPLCTNSEGQRIAKYSARYTQECLSGPCPVRADILIYGNTCHCGAVSPTGCQCLKVQAEAIAPHSNPAVPTL